MWDTAQIVTHQLSHDMPCQRCGHAAHSYLACDDACACQPVGLPGDLLRTG